MMQGYRNLPGRYDVIADKEERRALWDGLFHDGFPPQTLDEAWQVLVWFRLWLRGQAGVPRFPTRVVEKALDLALRDKEARL